MANKQKHRARSRRSHHSNKVSMNGGIMTIANKSQQKQSLFKQFKETMFHRKQLQDSKEGG